MDVGLLGVSGLVVTTKWIQTACPRLKIFLSYSPSLFKVFKLDWSFPAYFTDEMNIKLALSVWNVYCQLAVMCCRVEIQRNARQSTAGDITVTALITGLPLGLEDFTSAEFWQLQETCVPCPATDRQWKYRWLPLLDSVDTSWHLSVCHLHHGPKGSPYFW